MLFSRPTLLPYSAVSSDCPSKATTKKLLQVIENLGLASSGGELLDVVGKDPLMTSKRSVLDFLVSRETVMSWKESSHHAMPCHDLLSHFKPFALPSYTSDEKPHSVGVLFVGREIFIQRNSNFII